MGRLFGYEGEGERKVVGSDCFLNELTKIQSSQNGRKLERKGGRCVLDKITLPYLWGRKPKYILGLRPCPRRHSGLRIDQQ